MELSLKKMLRRRRAALVLLVIGVLCLCLDFPYRTQITYPDYEFAEHYGPDTQRMIMEDVVGTRLKIDFASELLGYLFLFLSLIIVSTFAKPELPMKKAVRKMMSRFGWLMPRAKFRFIMIPFVGAVVYTWAQVLPFLANGISVYGPEYFLHLGLIFIEAASLLFATLCFLRECDRYQNHKETQFIYLFLILTVITGVLRGFAAFYGVHGVENVYTVLNWAFVAVMCITLVHYVYTEELIARQTNEECSSDNDSLSEYK
ncbi:MAG: hypothetical protein IJM57_10810 [Lachnospiraceae bacterium]|nr:hypothetical protein [Lachnospiraceae bacterium]